MPRINVVENRGQTRDRLGRFQKKLGEFRDRHLESLAELVVSVSPVDTGTYITSHEITPGTGGSYTATSHGKPRKQPREPFEQQGIMSLMADISAIPLDVPTVSLTNNAEHADIVEQMYGPYAIVRREAGRLAREVMGDV